MKMTTSRFLIILFGLCAWICTVHAETPTKQAVDPALQAIEALGGDTTEPAADTGSVENQQTTTTDSGDSSESADVSGTMEAIEDAPVTEDTVVETPEDKIPLKDVILVLDNSGSMKKNDPQFLANQAVNQFINQLDAETRIAIIVFDQGVRYALPMTEFQPENLSSILDSLKQLDYKGLYTDSPAAMERAIYDLKTGGREDAKKIIIFMTDGIVDTGNKDKDLEKAKWLKQDLAEDAADSGIQIFGIAFTESADFELIQSLAQKTDGEYFRALQADDLNSVFDKIHTVINKVPEPEVVAPPPEPVQVAPPPPPPPPPEPVIIQVPVQSEAMDKEQEFRSRMILVALTVLILAVIIMVLMLIRGSRRKTDDDYAQEAFINDIHNYTSKASYKLGKKPTMLGRVAGTDTDHLDYIVIPETTIGRRHALIEYKDFAYWIIDQGSINGTFVNDQMVTSETRLKHGDRVRLHKCEFEFVMPEMNDAGMTVISKTVMAANPGMASADDEDATIARDTASEEEEDFDLSEAFGSQEVDDMEETMQRQVDDDSDNDISTPDETIMMDEDEDSEDEDATIRPDMVNEVDLDMTVDRFSEDIDDDDEKKK